MGNNKRKIGLIPGIAMALTSLVLVGWLVARTELTHQRTSPENSNPQVSTEVFYDYETLSFVLAQMTLALHYENSLAVHGEHFDLLDHLTTWEAENSEDWNDEDWEDHYDHMEWLETIRSNTQTSLNHHHTRLSELVSIYGMTYLVIDQEGVVTHSPGSGPLLSLDQETIDFQVIQELQDTFAQVVVIRYNSTGRWQVPFLLSSETEGSIHHYLNRNDGQIDGPIHGGGIPGINTFNHRFGLDILNHYDEYDDNYFNSYNWRHPEDLIFVFGVSHHAFDAFIETGRITEWINDYDAYESRWWLISQAMRSIHTISIWTMVILAFLIPLEKIKKVDKGYEYFTKLPIEIVLFITWFIFDLTHRNLWSVIHLFSETHLHSPFSYLQIGYTLALLFMMLTLLGYIVVFIKGAHAEGWRPLKEQSFLYRLINQAEQVDLKKDLKTRIVSLIVGQTAAILALLFFTLILFPDHQLFALIFIYLPAYLAGAYLYAVKKVEHVQQDYSKLLQMTQDIKNGTLDGKITESLGLFDPLKNELDNIQDGLSQAVERRISSERMKSELITNVSHDLKTPLTAIITYVDLLQDDSLNEEKRKLYLDTLDAKTERLKTLIEDLFEVSKASTGNIQMELREVDVVILMKQTLLGLEDLLAESDLVIRENYPDPPTMLHLDGDRTHRIFENLIVNMAKYAMPRTRAYIDIVKGDYQTDIILRNISAHELKDQLEDLSERFVRGDESRSTEGSGLGLAIAKSFVELQGGTFQIKTDGDLFKVIISFKA